MSASKPPRKVVTRNTFEVDPTWSYRDDAWQRIAKALDNKDKPTVTELAKVRSRIEDAARFFRGRAEHEHTRPRTGTVRAEIQGLDQTIRCLRKRITELSEAAGAHLDDWGIESDRDCELVTSRLRRIVTTLDHVRLTIEEVANTPARKGPPRQRARERFIEVLAHVWHERHPEWPTRKATYKGAEFGPFGSFVEACLKPAGAPLEGVEHDIRDAVEKAKMRSAMEDAIDTAISTAKERGASNEEIVAAIESAAKAATDAAK